VSLNAGAISCDRVAGVTADNNRETTTPPAFRDPNKPPQHEF